MSAAEATVGYSKFCSTGTAFTSSLRRKNFYKNCCQELKVSVQNYIKDVDFSVGCEPCSYDGTVHYSYHYEQQLHYPTDPNQHDPIYFKTPRKCALFGICCEAIPCQINFLIDESVQTAKGSNSTISYVHYFFQRHGLGETKMQLHADNYGAQNKNSAFLWYYSWWVMNGLPHSINYDFLLPGHTKFSPDWCFGLMKQKTRRTFTSSLFDIARTVEDSASVNVAELVGLHNGTVLVEMYDWTTYLGQYFKKLHQIKTFSNSDSTRIILELSSVSSIGTLRRRPLVYLETDIIFRSRASCPNLSIPKVSAESAQSIVLTKSESFAVMELKV